jgi:hypothetical protein
VSVGQVKCQGEGGGDDQKAFQLLGEIHSLKLGRVAAWAGFFTASPWLSVYAYWTVTKLCIIEQYSFHYLFTKLRGE